MRTVQLGGGKAAGRVTEVDDGRDYDLAMQHRWHVQEQQRANGAVHGPYAVTHVRRPDGRRTKIFLHTLLTGWPKVDHHDGNGLNNQRRTNLRKATDGQNQHNQGKRAKVASSRFKGVSWDGVNRKWRAIIRADGKTYNLGRFAVEEAAARAYDAKALELHRDFARLNFPAEGTS